jgi:hypothetical protein
MVSIMVFPRKSLQRDQAAKTGSAAARGRRRVGKDAQRVDAQRAAFVDPVHGRHCICTRCAQHRAA